MDSGRGVYDESYFMYIILLYAEWQGLMFLASPGSVMQMDYYYKLELCRSHNGHRYHQYNFDI